MLKIFNPEVLPEASSYKLFLITWTDQLNPSKGETVINMSKKGFSVEVHSDITLNRVWVNSMKTCFGENVFVELGERFIYVTL